MEVRWSHFHNWSNKNEYIDWSKILHLCLCKKRYNITTTDRQASHAALQAGLKFTNPSSEPNSLIVIGIRNKEQLLKAMSFLEKNNIAYESFSEPSWDYGLTAFASQPILETDRKVFKSFQLWRNS